MAYLAYVSLKGSQKMGHFSYFYEKNEHFKQMIGDYSKFSSENPGVSVESKQTLAPNQNIGTWQLSKKYQKNRESILQEFE